MSSRSLSRNRNFMLLWSGQTISQLGSQLSLVAYPLLVLALTGSPAKAGLVGFARTVPVPVLALPAGALADRVDRRHLMVACDLVRALALAAIPVALLIGSAPYPLIVAVAAVDGAGFVTSYVSERGVLRQIVAARQLRDAVARNESRFFGAMLAGPPLGGALFGLGRAIPFLADAVSYVISAVTMLLIRPGPREEPVQPSQPGFREGFRWLWKRPFFRGCSLLFAGSNPIFTGVYLLVVVLAKRHGASPALIGVMLGIAAAGGLLGALIAPTLARRLSARTVLIVESWLIAAAMTLLLLAHEALVLGVIVAAAELVTPVTNSIVVSYRVALAPDRLQGRVQAASTLISFSAGWLGPLLVGALLGSAGSTATIVVLAGWASALAIVASIAPAFRHRIELPVLPSRSGGPEPLTP